MNKCILIGRLVRDPELKFTPGNGNAVTQITLAVDKYNSQTKQKEADFISVTIWGKQAESTANYMSKGSLMAISGRIQTRSYDDKEGNKRFITEVVANEVQFLDSKKGNKPEQQSYDDMEPVDDGDIPFK